MGSPTWVHNFQFNSYASPPHGAARGQLRCHALKYHVRGNVRIQCALPEIAVVRTRNVLLCYAPYNVRVSTPQSTAIRKQIEKNKNT